MIKDKNTIIIDNDKYKFFTGKLFYYLTLFRKIKFFFQILFYNYHRGSNKRYINLFYNSKIQIDTNRIISKTMYHNPNKNIILDNKYIYEPKETNFLIKILSNYNTFIDIGSHQGYYSYLASKHCKLVYSIEPLKEFYNEIKYHIKLNSINNIILINQGLGNGKTIKYGNYLQIKTFQTKKFKDFYNEKNIHGSCLLKIDVDGFEKDLIEGCEDLLKNKNIDIIMDIYFDRIHNGYDLLDIMKSTYQNAYLLKENDFKNNYLIENLNKYEFKINKNKNNKIYSFFFSNKSI